jgi:hypothetical protein
MTFNIMVLSIVYRYAVSRLFNVMLNVVRLTVIMLNVIMLNVVMLNVMVLLVVRPKWNLRA